MVSPNLLSKKYEYDTVEVSNNAKRIFQAIYNQIKEEEKEEEEAKETDVIKVSELVSKMAFFYEKLRNAVDYDDDHLLRKNAIYRILKRQVIIEGMLKIPNSYELAEHLLQELIRGSYLMNASVPRKRIDQVAIILEKYLLLKNSRVSKINSDLTSHSDVSRAKDLIKEKNSSSVWLLSLAACEIEDLLGRNQTRQAIVTSLFEVLSKKIVLPDNHPNEKDLKLQIYLSICRNFLKLDKDMLSLVVFKYYNTGWGSDLNNFKELPEKEKIEKIAVSLNKLKGSIDYQLEHPLKKQLDKISHRFSLYFTILSETIDKAPIESYNLLKNNSKNFFSSVAKVCHKKYKFMKSRLWRAAWRSIIYIFLTKSIFVVLIEVPAIKWFGEELSLFILGINIAFPAILLFFIVLLTQTPGKENTDKIIEGVQEISLKGQEQKRKIVLHKPRKRGKILNTFFHILYLLCFAVSLYAIYWVLNYLGFTWVSILIFLFFLAFVSFFSVRITKGVKELLVIEKRESLIALLIDLFYMPIIVAGKWLSNNASRVNIFIFIFDFIIEAPFKVLVNVAEDWTRYVKERKDNLS
jgi:hypothetical protein